MFHSVNSKAQAFLRFVKNLRLRGREQPATPAIVPDALVERAQINAASRRASDSYKENARKGRGQERLLKGPDELRRMQEGQIRGQELFFRNMERVAQGHLRCECGNDSWIQFFYTRVGTATTATCKKCGRAYDYKGDMTWSLSIGPTSSRLQASGMIVTVELHGLFSYGAIRKVNIGEHHKDQATILNATFNLGQDEVQPQAERSVSVGDVILLGDKRFAVMPYGFRKLSEEAYQELLTTERCDPREVQPLMHRWVAGPEWDARCDNVACKPSSDPALEGREPEVLVGTDREVGRNDDRSASANRGAGPSTPRLFEIGNLFCLTGCKEALDAAETLGNEYLKRHMAGDWGDVSAEDAALSDKALVEGKRIMSAYTLPTGVTFWIFTEADRKRTTFLLPSEY